MCVKLAFVRFAIIPCLVLLRLVISLALLRYICFRKHLLEARVYIYM